MSFPRPRKRLWLQLHTAWNIVSYVWHHPGTQTRRGRSVARFAVWQVWQRTIGKPWTVALGPNARIRCYPHGTASSAVIYCRLPDWPEMNFLMDFLRPGDLFLDVGANVGAYTVLAAGIPDVQVIALEPSDAAWRRLKENIQMNGFTGVEALRVAAAEKSGVLLLTRDQDTVNRVVEAGGFDGRTESVEGVTVDEVISIHGDGRALSLMKVDVEGYEPAVLRGALKVLAADSPALIVENNLPDEIDRVITSLGYRWYSYSPSDRALSPVDPRVTALPNVIALRDFDATVERLSVRAPRSRTRRVRVTAHRPDEGGTDPVSRSSPQRSVCLSEVTL